MSEANYFKSATRDIRPFFGVAALEEAIATAQIRLYEDQPFADATAFTVEEQDAEKLKVAVRPNLSEAAVASCGIERSKLLLVITAFNPFLKRTLVLLKAALTQEAPDELEIPDECLRTLGGGVGITVEVAVCLAKQLPKQAGSPFLRGHWLAKKIFEIRPPSLAEDFSVDTLNDEGWRAMGLPAKTLYLVQYYSGVNEPVSKERPMAKVYLHEEAQRKLTVDTHAKMARPILAFLAAEIPCQILAASLSEWKDVDTAEPRSPLQTFLKRINRVQPCTMEQLRSLVEEPGMQRLRAILHADQGSVRHIAEA